MTFADEEVREAIRMVRAEGHSACAGPLPGTILVRRMVVGGSESEWMTILAAFYDTWLDGDDNVPSSWDDAFEREDA